MDKRMMISRADVDHAIDLFMKGKQKGIVTCIDAISEMHKSLSEKLEQGDKLPFEHPDCVVEGIRLALSELQNFMRY